MKTRAEETKMKTTSKTQKEAPKKAHANSKKAALSGSKKALTKGSTKKTIIEGHRKTRQGTITAVAEELIKAGKTNEQVFTALQDQFQLAATKKWYPSWFRARLIREKRQEPRSHKS